MDRLPERLRAAVSIGVKVDQGRGRGKEPETLARSLTVVRAILSEVVKFL
jgi:hypothetical protein